MKERKESLERTWTIVDGLRIHARVAVDAAPPEAPVVILVHGLVVSSRYMVPTATRLAPYFHVYAPDLPGFGKSDQPPQVLNVVGLADALAAWMDATGLQQAALVGNSFGCQIIAEFAVRYPQRIERIVLQGPTFDPQARTLPRQTVRWLINSFREPLSLGLILVRDYIAAGVRRTVRTIQCAMRNRIEENLPLIRVPVLVVRGSRDPIIPQRWAEEATRLLPMGRLVVIPGPAHTINYAAPLEFVRVMRPFLYEQYT